jgi:hypothetical protein
MEKQDMNDEREAFEAWYEPDPHNREALTTYRHKDGNYYNAPYLAGCWQGWQARAALPAAQPTEQPWPDAYQMLVDGKWRECSYFVARGFDGKLSPNCRALYAAPVAAPTSGVGLVDGQTLSRHTPLKG